MNRTKIIKDIIFRSGYTQMEKNFYLLIVQCLVIIFSITKGFKYFNVEKYLKNEIQKRISQ